MAGATDLIRDWAAELDCWEQAALEKIVSDRRFTDDDYSYPLELFLQDAGLSPSQPGARPTLSFPAKLARTGNLGIFRLERLFSLRGVNALPPAQEIRFGTQLTIIYGRNSAEKTGYTRPLGCAAFARGDREVLMDARKTELASDPQC